MLNFPFLSAVAAAGLMAAVFSGLAPRLAAADSAFDVMARELVAEIVARERSGIRIAVVSPDANESPVEPQIAGDMAEELENALVLAARGQVDVVLRAGLGALFSELWSHASPDGSRERAYKLMREANAFDVAVMAGEWRRVDSGWDVRFQAVELETGVVLAAPARGAPAAPPGARHGLDRAVRNAAEAFHESAPDMSLVLTAGIRYEDTERAPPFAGELQRRLTVALQERISDPRTGRVLAVRPFDTDPATVRGGHGGSAPAWSENLAEHPDLGDGAYVLAGQYWVLPGHIEFFAGLYDRSGRVAGVRERAFRDGELAGFALIPGDDFRFLTANDGKGPFRFTLTTPGGGAPEMAVGELLYLELESGIDAWVSCYQWSRDNDGHYALYKIYPNEGTDEVREGVRRKGQGRGRISAGRSHIIPSRDRKGDEATDPFALIMAPPVGAELFKCVATDRDVSDVLPYDLGVRGVAKLPAEAAERLSSAFRATGARVAEASITLNVVPAEARQRR